MKATTKSISTVDLSIGNIVHFHGARFEIYSAMMVAGHADRRQPAEQVMVAMGKWLDGDEVTGYFGRTKDWNFQGNKNARVNIEVAA